MARKLLEALALFAIPFALYALALLVRRQFPASASWSAARLAMLTVAGLGLVALGMVLLGAFAERHQGAFVPAHMEDGRLVPGRMQ